MGRYMGGSIYIYIFSCTFILEALAVKTPAAVQEDRGNPGPSSKHLHPERGLRQDSLAVKEFKSSYQNSETMLFAIYIYISITVT